MTPVAHIATITAVWTMMLFGLRFFVDALGWVRPVIRSIGKPRREMRRVVDQLHDDLIAKIVSPWSATLLFGGGALIGLGYASGSSGDIAVLLSKDTSWTVFDVVTDCIAAVFAVTGMSCVLAATSDRRRVSFAISAVLVLTGAGIGSVTV